MAFGTFEQNWTLRCVCDDCNSLFSRDLELFLARDSIEAILRLRYGLKAPEAAKKLRNQRTVITIDQPGPWLGARAFLSPTLSGDELEILPLAQVRFRRPPETNCTWVLEENLSPETVEPFHGPGVEVRIVGPDDDALVRLNDAVRDLGITFREQTRTDEKMTDENNRIQFATESALDRVLFRGVTKIAFNYAAYVLGGDFVRGPDFDQVRHFVLRGTTPDWQLLNLTRTPILADDSERVRQTRSHLCLVEWDESQNGIRVRLSSEPRTYAENYRYSVAACVASNTSLRSVSG